MSLIQQRHLAIVLQKRPRPWTIRGVIAAVIAMTFSSQTGAVFAALWFAAFIAILGLEWVARPGGLFLRNESEKAMRNFMQLQMLASNSMFGLFAVALAKSGSSWSLGCACMIIAAGVVNSSVTTTNGSRRAIAVVVAPHLVLLGSLLWIVWRSTHSALGTLQLGVGSILLSLGAIAAWSRLAAMVGALEASQRQADEASRAKSAFLATMSHEIRTPLNGVLGMAQAMGADVLSARQRERLEVVSESGKALLVILGDVLDLAKIEAGKLDLELRAFDLEALIDQSQSTFRAIAESKGLKLEVAVEPSALGGWMGDATRLRQIISNLISNAVKFTDEGDVSVRSFSEGNQLVVTVQDTGRGVTPDQLSRLFGRFVQANASTTREFGGTGLGLAICGELAELMGGTIVASHVEPRGLAFRLSLPLRPTELSESAKVRGTSGCRLQEASELCILAAEDHPVNRQVLTVLLSQVGIIPYIVENGEAAVEAWRNGDWDLILMDVQMPVMDGPTAAMTIRAEERSTGRASTPIIALTANVMTYQIEEYRQAGMAQVVAKPIQFQVLLAAIEQALTGPLKAMVRDESGDARVA